MVYYITNTTLKHLMKHTNDYQYYEDLYDLITIKECLVHKRHSPKDYKEFTVKGRKMKISLDKVDQFFIYYITGERFKRKKEAIEEWIKRDQKKDEIVENAYFPENINCPMCSEKMFEEVRELMDDSDVRFIARCKHCKKGVIIEKGKILKPEKPKCPKCQSLLKSKHTFKNDVSTNIEKCPSCDYTKTDICDFKKSRMRWEKEKKKDKELLSKHREKYCLTEEAGQEYILSLERIKRLNALMKESEEKLKDPDYIKAKKVKKLTSTDLFKLLQKVSEKAKYVNLVFDKPELARFVIIPFTIQDNKKSRVEFDSKKELKKLINTNLEKTNWRLMSDGIQYRMGYLTGKLKGYENEEELAKFIKKKRKALYYDKKGAVY
jgi:hypothetical protein